jgi:hypothetical protein
MDRKIIAGILLVVGGAFQAFLLIGGALQTALTDYYLSSPTGFRIYLVLRIPTIVTLFVAGILLLIEDPGEKRSKASGGFLVGNATSSTMLLVLMWWQNGAGVAFPRPMIIIPWMLVPGCIAMFGILLVSSETSKVKKAGVAFLLYACLEAVSMVILLLVEDVVSSYVLTYTVSTCWAGGHVFLFIGAILLIRVNR